MSPDASTRLAATAVDSLMLMCGARLVAEDDVYVVVTAKIAKSWLAANLGFLAALADCCAPPRGDTRSD